MAYSALLNTKSSKIDTKKRGISAPMLVSYFDQPFFSPAFKSSQSPAYSYFSRNTCLRKRR